MVSIGDQKSQSNGNVSHDIFEENNIKHLEEKILELKKENDKLIKQNEKLVENSKKKVLGFELNQEKLKKKLEMSQLFHSLQKT